ncbi:hypothetical protein PINS_up021831 [Pythium insidiosum]|nr:hypothetical protein PINS_up021831 [Pythium insidiosum]
MRCAKAEQTSSMLMAVLARTQEQVEMHNKMIEKQRRERQEADNEIVRLRDMLYETRESEEYQREEILRLQRECSVLKRSRDSKQKQIDGVMRERDELARKLAQARGKTSAISGRLERRASAPEVHRSIGRRPSLCGILEDECKEDFATLRAASSGIQTTALSSAVVIEYETQMDALRAAVKLAKSRFEKERNTNAVLRSRVEQLEKSKQELLVRLRAVRQPNAKTEHSSRMSGFSGTMKECREEQFSDGAATCA